MSLVYKGEGNGNPLQYSCLENSVDGGAWLATVHGVAKSQTWLSDFTFFLSIVLFGGRNGNPLQCSCLENPMDGGAWWASLWGCKELDKIKQLTHSLVYKSLLNELAWLVEQGMLLLLGRFSHVRLCAIPQTAAHQTLPSLGFSRQEHWSGLPFPSLMHESEKWKWSRSLLSDSLQSHGSSVHGIFQARVLEWGAIWAKYKCK